MDQVSTERGKCRRESLFSRRDVQDQAKTENGERQRFDSSQDVCKSWRCSRCLSGNKRQDSERSGIVPCFAPVSVVPASHTPCQVAAPPADAGSDFSMALLYSTQRLDFLNISMPANNCALSEVSSIMLRHRNHGGQHRKLRATLLVQILQIIPSPSILHSHSAHMNETAADS